MLYVMVILSHIKDKCQYSFKIFFVSHNTLFKAVKLPEKVGKFQQIESIKMASSPCEIPGLCHRENFVLTVLKKTGK